jgi:hypothetical protein
MVPQALAIHATQVLTSLIQGTLQQVENFYGSGRRGMMPQPEADLFHQLLQQLFPCDPDLKVNVVFVHD